MPSFNDKQFYEQLWTNFSGEFGTQLAIHLESRRPLLKLLGSCVPEGKAARFLETGCGTALDTSLLAQRFSNARAYALDLSVNALTLAQKNAKQMAAAVHLLAADLAALPFPDAHFDLVFSQGVLEHFADPSAAMREQVRVLKPGGALVVDVPQKYNVYTLRKREAMRANRWPWGWETQYSVGELRAWAPQYGLEAFDAIGYQHGRWLDRLVIHPHRFVRRRLRRWKRAPAQNYQPGRVAHVWESAWDWIDAHAGPYVAINVAVAFRKCRENHERLQSFKVSGLQSE